MPSMSKRRNLQQFEIDAANRLKNIWVRQKGELGLTQETMAFECGWKTQGAFNQYLNAKIPLNLKALLLISRTLKVRPGDISQEIVDSVGSMQAGALIKFEQTVVKEKDAAHNYEEETVQTKQMAISEGLVSLLADTVSIFQHNEVVAALGDGAAPIETQSTITMWQVTRAWLRDNVPANTGGHNLRIVTGDGDSMPGYFNGGDPILIDVGVTTLVTDGLYFFQYEGDNYIKRLQKVPDGILVVSSNPDVKDWTITPDKQLQIFGRALKAWESKAFA